MRFATKLGVFAAVLVVGSSVYKITEKFGEGDRDHDFAAAFAGPHDAPEIPNVPDSPDNQRPPEPPETPRGAVTSPFTVRVGHPDEVRIFTHNSAAFLALRHDHLVAGLSDSIREMVSQEMRKDMSRNRSTGVGDFIEKAVRSSVEKLLEKEIEVPVSEIRDIEYQRNRIVIEYRNGEPSGMINLETLKSEGDKSLLEQFSEADARRLVAAVKGRIR